MKNTMLSKVIAIILLVAVAGLLTYFYISLNRMEKNMNDLQTTMAENSGAINEVVNFFNANLNAGQNTN